MIAEKATGRCKQKKCRLETGRQVHARFDYA
nr:MAG TPA: hypothetical protein [Caudoviricetes sp.]